MGLGIYLRILSIALAALLLLPAFGFAQGNGYPQDASLKRNEVNVRAGPGTRYPILWVFQRQGWPVQILAKYDNWYKIKDIEGEEGWVYLGMVSKVETAVVSEGEPALMHKRADGTRPVYRLGQGVVVQLDACSDLQCEVEIRGTSGWVDKSRLISFK